MPDKVQLIIGDVAVENFVSYTMEADIYTADDAFSVELANPSVQIPGGKECKVRINGELELHGILDKITTGGDKSKNTLKVEGRDLMGLLVDAYAEEFIDLKGMKLKTLAERLLKKIPFINRKAVDYQQNIVGKLKGGKKGKSSVSIMDTAQTVSRIEAGMTVFDVLKGYAASRGLLFFLEYEGDQAKFIFGMPKAKGEPLFHLLRRKVDSGGNNVISGEKVEDLSKRYRTVKVIGQQQGFDAISMTAINAKGFAVDKTFPFEKTYVTKNNNDAQSPKLHARMLMTKMRREGFRLSYKVAGHAQGKSNWKINELCRVTDEVLGIDGTFLIYGRKFELSRQGATTMLELSHPGELQ